MPCDTWYFGKFVFVRQTHSTIRCLLNLAAYVAAGMGFAVPAQGGTIDAVGAAPTQFDWQITRVASGWGTAQVFDGGPEVFDDGDTTGPSGIVFDAFDFTGSGASGADYSSTGRIRIGFGKLGLGLDVDFSSTYIASSHINADRPGGRGAGKLTTVVEFVMPVDELLWEISYRIRQSPGFSGSSRVLVENVTQFVVVRDLMSDTFTDTVLTGNEGDLIRITASMAGEGEVPAGFAFAGGYSTDFSFVFLVPEPTTGALLSVGALILFRRRTFSSNPSSSNSRSS